MRVRARFANLIKKRLGAYVPQALETVWSEASAVVLFETMKFTSVGGTQTDGTGTEWEVPSSFAGVVLAEMRADVIDGLDIAPLIDSLIVDLPFIAADPQTEVDGLTEQARFTLIEMRDGVRDSQIVTKLRFDVQGFILRRLNDVARPDLMVGEHPEIGAAHEDYYAPFDNSMGVLASAIVGAGGTGQ